MDPSSRRIQKIFNMHKCNQNTSKQRQMPQLLLLLVSPLFAPLLATAADTAACTVGEQQEALVDMYRMWGGPDWHTNPGWLDSAMECDLKGSQFPAHCCWHGITCCLSRTCSEGNSPSFDQCGCEPGLVWEINLGNNNLVGNFTSFDHKPFACALQRLVLSDNDLTEEIGQDIQMHAQLSYLDLQSNRLQGHLPEALGQISSLRQLYLSKNSLVGTVPPGICGNASRLNWLTLDDNQFSGPLDVSRCRQLIYLTAKGNNILVSGRPENALPMLRGVFFDDNNLRGLLPDDLFANVLPNLESLGTSKNRLSGRLPGMSMYSLKEIILNANRFVGTIPDSWSRMAQHRTRVKLDTNFLSCCGIKPLPTETLIQTDEPLHIDEVYGGVDYSAPLLPPFLELSDFLQPVNVNEGQSFKAAGMRCPALKLAGPDERLTSPLDWTLDPPYYMFAKCECEEGLKLVNLTKPGRIPYFECQVPESATPTSDSEEHHNKWIEDYPWVVVIVVFVGCGLLVALSFILYLYKGKLLIRKLRNLKKRAHGLPKSGPFTVVVTDIQGWTALCAKHPELSVKVLNIHNSIIRQAQWLNFGCTHETEGDSFTIVFFDARDAAAFCLQTQQLLSMQQWPSPQQGLNVAARTPSSEVQASSDSILPVRVYNNPLRNEGPGSADAVLPTRVYNNPLGRMSSINVDGTHNPSRRQSLWMDASFQGTFNRLFMIRDASTQAVGHMAKLASTASSRYWTKLSQDAERGKPPNTDIRVRMGMASGILQPGKRLHGHPIIEKAKEVSDAAAGGQILMDGSTFAEIKDFLQELGSVDAQGIHPDQVRWQKVITWSAWFMCWFLSPPRAVDESAVALDMGVYVEPEEEDMMYLPGFSSMGGPSLKHLKSANHDLHLFQIMHPLNAERSKEWGGKLRMKTELRLKDSLSKGYFDAPGMLAAPLGISKNPADGTLPMVTIVSAAVEHARILPNSQLRQVEPGLLECVRKALDLVEEDGYLCHMPDNLRVTLCFSKPEAALAWSCAVQECMLYQEWPNCVLIDPFREGRDLHGNLIFRGPRLKIGISQGRPDSIRPNRMGRAEYHGDCVKCAYNIMEGGAQGGMILCEQDLAVKAAETWSSIQPPDSGLLRSMTAHVIDKEEEKDLRTSRPWEHLQLQRQHKSFNGRTQHGPSTSPECSMKGGEDRQTSRSLPGSFLSEPLCQSPQMEWDSSSSEPERGGSGTNQQCLSNIHVRWFGWFSFKGTHDRKMVYVLQERLASRTYCPKSLNSFIATMVSHVHPGGPSMRMYQVPLPVLDPQCPQEPLEPEAPTRPSPSLFSDSDSSEHSSEDLLGASFSSWQEASQGASHEASSTPEVSALSEGPQREPC